MFLLSRCVDCDVRHSCACKTREGSCNRSSRIRPWVSLPVTVLATLGTFSNLNHAAGYQQRSFAVTQFKGQTVQIRFIGKEDSSLQTSFVIDDTALTVQ
jgi:hypothetical protein